MPYFYSHRLVLGVTSTVNSTQKVCVCAVQRDVLASGLAL